MLVSKGLRVLVASYTHSAVDNLLTKLKDAGVDESVALRIGSEHAVDERLRSYMIDYSDVKTLNSLRNKVHSARIIVCSALSAARHPLLQRTKFDWCVMDEAGQISQPAAIGPLLFAHKFLLVGDDYQLPPLIMSIEAKSMVSEVNITLIIHVFVIDDAMRCYVTGNGR
jgi:DNA replication ATP-dependent helicase Dna2